MGGAGVDRYDKVWYVDTSAWTCSARGSLGGGRVDLVNPSSSIAMTAQSSPAIVRNRMQQGHQMRHLVDALECGYEVVAVLVVGLPSVDRVEPHTAGAERLEPPTFAL